MINRRRFLHTSLGVGLGGSIARTSTAESIGCQAMSASLDARVGEYERLLAASHRLDCLGIPRSWSQVRQGFHPLTPERIVVLSRRNATGFPDAALQQVRERVEERKAHWQESPTLRMRNEKFTLLVQVIARLTALYHRQDLFVDWASQLVLREELGSTCLRSGFGLVHQFQRTETVQIQNSLVDWWLFLLPDGADFESWDDKPAYTVVAHVFDCRRPELQLQVWSLTGQLLKRLCLAAEHDDAGSVSRQLAGMDRISAAWHLNRELAFCLRDDAV